MTRNFIPGDVIVEHTFAYLPTDVEEIANGTLIGTKRIWWKHYIIVEVCEHLEFYDPDTKGMRSMFRYYKIKSVILP